MSETKFLNMENIFNITIDFMALVEQEKESGQTKKNMVLVMLEEYIGEEFPIYKKILDNVIDGVCMLAKNKKILDKIKRNNLCCKPFLKG